MTIIIGIDIAKYHHQALILSENGEVIVNSFSFENNHQGFQEFHHVLLSLDPTHKIKIGFEATGHYGNNLKNFLMNLGFDFMEIHPVLINQFSKAYTLRKTKTDKLDVKVICSYLTSVDYQPYLTESYHINQLKSLTRFRDSLVKQRSLQLQSMTNIMDHLFPEFKPFFKNSLKSATAIYLLTSFETPSRIARLNLNSYNKMKSQLHRTISYARFCELKTLAKNTIGIEDPLRTFQLQACLKLYLEYNHQIQETEQLIEYEFSKVTSHIQTIPGIGLISAAGIYSEIGGISRFNHPDKLVSFCGLDASYYQSGEAEFTGRMVKRGSSYLRQYLMNVATTSLIHNPHLYEYYSKKRREDKHHRVALSHVAKKLIRTIFKLETDQIDFDIQQMR